MASLVLAEVLISAQRPPPPFVLIGHAASLTPDYSDTPRPSPRTNRWAAADLTRLWKGRSSWHLRTCFTSSAFWSCAPRAGAP